MTVPVDTNILDPRSLADLKRLSKTKDPQALKAAARQFEAMFLQMVLKSMRDATPKDSFMESDQTRMYESLLDQQMSQVLATRGNGTGLAAVIEKQLSQTGGVDPEVLEGGLPLSPPAKAQPLQKETVVPIPLPSSVPGGRDGSKADAGGISRDFVARVLPAAQEASLATGIPAHFLVAHAALETGWGRSEPRRADGSASFNLFGIKAGRSWTGPTVEASTTEYVDGVPQRQVERFRAYGSYAESFQDYARLLAGNPRYAGVLGTKDGSNFARGLQQAGYATDPQYAAKLERIISGVAQRRSNFG